MQPNPLRPAILALLLMPTLPVVAAAQAPAQNRFQVVNRTGQEASSVQAVRTGRGDWGGNLAPGPMPTDKALTLRPDADSGCRFDVRLLLADGREAVKRDQDICATRAWRWKPGTCGPPPRPQPRRRRRSRHRAGPTRRHATFPPAAASWWRRTGC
jgi:hypothetical protein